MDNGKVAPVTADQSTRFLSTTDWKYLGLFVLTFALAPVFYGLPLVSPLVATFTDLRKSRKPFVWLWIVAALLTLMAIAPFVLKITGLSEFETGSSVDTSA